MSNNLIKKLHDFTTLMKDGINEETMELMEPYLTFKAPNK